MINIKKVLNKEHKFLLTNIMNEESKENLVVLRNYNSPKGS